MYSAFYQSYIKNSWSQQNTQATVGPSAPAVFRSVLPRTLAPRLPPKQALFVEDKKLSKKNQISWKQASNNPTSNASTFCWTDLLSLLIYIIMGTIDIRLLNIAET